MIYSLYELREGSSPLARGLRPSPGGGERETLDHPRSRGVYPPMRTHPSCILGSSPLARGLLIQKNPTKTLSRIIPARAGFTMEYGY